MELPGDPDQLLLVFMPSGRSRTAEALSVLASLQASGRPPRSAAPRPHAEDRTTSREPIDSLIVAK
jgi:hypothetical protein